MTDPNQNPQGDQTQQGGAMAQGGPSAQSATAGGDVRQMRVDDLVNIANQQNLDVSALENLIAQVNAANPQVAASGTGQASTGGDDPNRVPAGQDPAQGQQ